MSKAKLDGKNYDLSKANERDAYWAAYASKALTGKKISKVRYMTQAEASAHGWSNRPVVIQLEDGTLIYPSQDDEGNDGGTIFGQKGKEDFVFPVI
jgi:hypothetical protein